MHAIVRTLGLSALLCTIATGCLPARPPATATTTTIAVADDGPYVFREANGLHALWLCAGKQVRRDFRLHRDGTATLPVVCGYPHPLRVLPPAPVAPDALPMPARLAALSDIHGQFELMHRLLRANGVIDAQDRWAFGNGTLVVAGDVFDRGPRVTEVFWLLYELQQQAAATGGALHFVLGNHEAITLYDDLRYLNPKYATTAQLLGRPYPALYAADTVIGQWLRTRPTLLRLGDTLFLHGGIAPGNIDLVADLAATNTGYRASLGKPRAEVKADPATARLYDGKTSPIWYRGYFNDALDSAQVKALVERLGLERIVVGHTTMGEVASFHDGRVIAIDSGIKRGKSGQLLFIENERLSRGLLDGSRQPLPELQEVPDDPE